MARRMTAFERARAAGARAGQHEHLRLKNELVRQIDVFRIISQAGIWLMFQPMRDLFGAYQRHAEGAGIILNANHPSTLQRFTAAHEYGHHVLGHDFSLDDAEHIEGYEATLSEKEVAAQAFAADFLMPLQLVNYTLRRMGLPIKPGELSARDVYRVSLELGASYTATITQLQALKKISAGLARRLRKELPIAIKEDMVGARPHHARADVWVLDEGESGRELTPRVDDEVHVLLPERPSTGYVWRPKEDDGGGALVLSGESFEPATSEQAGAYGAVGTHHLVFRVLQPGDHTLRLVKQRPWQRDAPPAATFEARLLTVRRPTGESDHGLSEEQKEMLLAS